MVKRSKRTLGGSGDFQKRLWGTELIAVSDNQSTRRMEQLRVPEAVSSAD